MAIQDFNNKIVVVTGAASGIGLASALGFAREGANVVVADINSEGLGSLKSDIETLGRKCLTFCLDVADEQAVKDFAEAVKVQIGTPHVLINNAGIGYLGLFLKSDLAHWKRMLDVNVMGVAHGCHYFLPMMLEAGGPRHVINVSSSAGNYPAPSMAAYAASKGAVSRFTDVLQMELVDTPITVSVVCPGVINTNITNTPGGVAPSVADETIRKLREFYIREGSAPEVCARDMIAAVRKDADMVLTGNGAKLIYHVHRLARGLMRKAMIKNARQIGYL